MGYKLLVHFLQCLHCFNFLSDPSPIIGNACHLFDVTLACEDANSKLIEVVNVDDEDRVGNSLMHTWELKLGNKARLLFRL